MMKIFCGLALSIALAIGCSPVASAAGSEQTEISQFLAGIYHSYYSDRHQRQSPLADEPLIRRYFVQSLARDLIKDQRAAARRQEVGCIDHDFFVDGQDFQIRDLHIDVGSITGAKAAASVRFRNLGRPTEIKFTLRRSAAGWQIADMVADGNSLREALSRCARAQ